MIRRTLTTIASAGVIAATTAGPALACNQPTPTTSGSQPQQTQQARYAYDGHFRHHHHHRYLHWLNQQQGSDQRQPSSDNQQPQTAGSQRQHHCHPGDNSQGSSSQS